VLLQVTAIVALSSTMMSPFRALFEGFKTFYLLALKSGVPGRGSMGEGSVMGSIEAVIGDICQNSEQLWGTTRVVVHFGSSSLLQALAPPLSSHFRQTR
jgi:hypothetical protein